MKENEAKEAKEEVKIKENEEKEVKEELKKFEFTVNKEKIVIEARTLDDARHELIRWLALAGRW